MSRAAPVVLVVPLILPMAVLLSSWSDPALSQTTAPQDPAPATSAIVERAVSELTLVEVYAVDSRGRPVTDLRKEDMVLLVDGRVHPVNNFELRRYDVAEGTLPLPAVADAARYPRRFVLFFDDAFSRREAMTFARRSAMRFIQENMAPADQVSLISYGRRLRVLRDFTGDRSDLLAVIERSLDDPDRRSEYAIEMQERARQFDDLLPGRSPLGGDWATSKEVETLVNTFATEDVARMSRMLVTLRTLTDALSAWPGYKAIIYLGDGIPENPALDYVRPFGASGAESTLAAVTEKYSLSQEIRSLGLAASAGGVTLHTLQLSGLLAGSGSELRAAYRRSNSLETLAMNSGGTAWNSNDPVSALRAVEAQSLFYYMLAFVPDGEPDGAPHSVRLRTRRSGVKLNWRREFLRLRPREARQRAIQAAHLVPEYQPSLDLSAAPGPAAGSLRAVDIAAYLPSEQILFLPDGRGLNAQIEIGFVALDEGWREVARMARTLRIRRPADTSRPLFDGVNIIAHLALPAGQQSVTSVVTDGTGRVIGASRVTVPPARDDPPIHAFSLYAPDRISLWIDLAPGGEPDQELEVDATASLHPALATLFSPGEPAICAFRLPSGTRIEGRLQLSIFDDGAEVRSQRLPDGSLDLESGAVRFEVPLLGLHDGAYRLILQEDSGDRVRDLVSQNLTIRE